MTEVHSQRAHAKRSPSGAARWSACPGSVGMSEGIPDESSPYANEGTAAHELAAHCLREKVDPSDFADFVIDIKAETPEAMFIETIHQGNGDTTWKVDDDMIEAVDIYVNYAREIMSRADEIAIEERLEIKRIAPDMFGTGDFGAYVRAEKTLYVADYKHGKGVAVEAKGNKQGVCYGSGFVSRWPKLDIEKIVIVIVQPRCFHPDGPIREWVIPSYREFLEHVDELETAAEKTELENAPLSAGDHCLWCPASIKCAEAKNFALQAAFDDFSEVDVPKDDEPSTDLVPANPALLTPDQLGELLPKIDVIAKWCKQVKDYANEQARAGAIPTGFKLVAGKSKRVIKDPEGLKAVAELMFGIDPDDLMSEPEMLGITGVEKAVGKKNIKALTPFIEKTQGAPALVPVADPRKAVNHAPSEEFEQVDIQPQTSKGN